MAVLQVGVRFSEHEPATLNKKLGDYGFEVGELVTLHGHGLNSGGVIYRITKDSQPVDAVWGHYRDYYRTRWSGSRGMSDTRSTWCYVNKKGKPGQPVPSTRLKGCIELTPVFSLFPYSKGKKVVPYRQVKSRVIKVDVIKLGVSFYEFQRFLQDEARRMSSDDR